MRVRFYPGSSFNVTADYQTVFSSADTYETRTKKMLEHQFKILEALVVHAHTQTNDAKTLAVVLCGEDFLFGAEVCTEEEKTAKNARCMDRDIVFSFFANEMRELSKRYPHVLIIPGSVYANVSADAADALRYDQNGTMIKKSRIYVQNVAPVFFGGEWVHLIKKGDYLSYGNKSVVTEDEFLQMAEHGTKKVIVPFYREDELEMYNSGLVLFGQTPLPGEKALLDNLKQPEFTNTPLFNIEGIKFGLEICGDHTRRVLENHIANGEAPDFHLISSNGIGWTYNAAKEGGYRVQADANSANLTSYSKKQNDIVDTSAMSASVIEIDDKISIKTYETPSFVSKPELVSENQNSLFSKKSNSTGAAKSQIPDPKMQPFK